MQPDAGEREGEDVDRKLRHRLVAILAADGVEYSRLMAREDSGTLDALDAARAVFAAGIAEFEGRVVDMAGDSILAIFRTVSGASLASFLPPLPCLR
jgi:adenylate cyclase